jgi:hypothetical protein
MQIGRIRSLIINRHLAKSDLIGNRKDVLVLDAWNDRAWYMPHQRFIFVNAIKHERSLYGEEQFFVAQFEN